MKITITIEKDDDDQRQTMVIDGEERCYVGPLWECPEDAIIGRSLISCTEISDFMREAYEAGKRGEDFDVTTEDN